jgi:Ca2+-binding RTX toxin-like protein
MPSGVVICSSAMAAGTTYTASSSDKLGGGEKLDVLRGQSGPDVLHGGDQADQLYGGYGNDKVFGGPGSVSGGGPPGGGVPSEGRRENLYGGRGADLLAGGSGFENYNFDPGWGNDTISDSDANLVSFHGSQKDLSIGLRVGAGPEATDGTNSVEWGDAFTIRYLVGGSGNDTITGDGRSNDLAGSKGSDTINGGRGNDTLSGDFSYFTLFGSFDNAPDTIDCGPGTDTAFFDPTRDTVTNCETLNPF